MGLFVACSLSLVFFSAKELPEAIEKAGLVEYSSTLVLPAEKEFHNDIRGMRTLLKKMMDAERDRDALDAAVDGQASQQERLRGRYRQLQQMLANVPEGDVVQHNEIVMELNRMQAVMERGQEEDPQVHEIRGEFERARGEFLDRLQKLQESVEKIKQRYAELSADSAVTAAIETMNGDRDKPVALGPSRTFASDLKELERLSSKIKAESIKLREANGVHLVDVLLNGQTHEEFILDTGASFLCIPHSLAVKAGIEPDERSQAIQMKIANGEIIDGKLVRVESVRVGTFEVKNVDCAVLNERYSEVEPLLGNSFLGQFSHHIDPDGPTLVLTKVGESEPEKTRSSSSRRRRRSTQEE